MDNFTTNNYEMKRDIINFSKKICEGASKPESKFTMDMIYGISKSKDILLSSIASEYMGMELFLEFANNKQAIPYEKMQQLKIEAWNNLIKAAQKQSMRTEKNRTDNMFFRAVQELLESKKIYLKSYKNHQREPDMLLATFVGYYDEEKQRYYLLPNVIFNEVVKFYGIQGTKFPGNALSTWKYLKEAGRLFPGEKDRNKTRKSINGKLVTFIEVMAVDVFGTEEKVFGDYLNKFPINPENHGKNISVDEIELPF